LLFLGLCNPTFGEVRVADIFDDPMVLQQQQAIRIWGWASADNGMIHSLVGFPIRGAIWYQGESNHDEGMLYLEKMKALIQGWRELWGQGEFPFYYVQIAPYRYGDRDPTMLARFWEAQSAAQSIPKTAPISGWKTKKASSATGPSPRMQAHTRTSVSVSTSVPDSPNSRQGRVSPARAITFRAFSPRATRGRFDKRWRAESGGS
jgi:hypothetical protein